MPESNKKQLLDDLQPPPLKPVMTGLFIMVWAVAGYMFLSMLNAKTGTMDWISTTGFSVSKFNQALSGGVSGLGTLAVLIYMAAFAQFSGFTWFINCIFLWIFGSHVERQIGNIQFLLLFLLLVPCGFLLIGQDPWSGPGNTLYVTPILSLLALMGAYMSMAPQKGFKIHIWTKPAGEIHQPQRPVPEASFVPPWYYAGAFLLWAVLSEYIIRTPSSNVAAAAHLPYLQEIIDSIFGKPPLSERVSVLSPLAALASLIVGAVAGYVFYGLSRAPERGEMGALQLQAALRYKELRGLDMTHEDAVSAVAKLLNVPLENVREWIKQGVSSQKQ